MRVCGRPNVLMTAKNRVCMTHPWRRKNDTCRRTKTMHQDPAHHGDRSGADAVKTSIPINSCMCRLDRGATAEHGADLLHGVAEVVVDGGDAGEVELGRWDCAGQNLHADCEQASDGTGRTIAAAAAAVADDGACWGSRRDDESSWEEGNIGRVLTAHRHLDGVDVDGSVHDDAAAGGVSAAFLKQELYTVGGVACRLSGYIIVRMGKYIHQEPKTK
ncbi:hypothetical protein BHM03_00026805 [Ensete ventricosum]|nr:hypothetical protein BHM03_00026805 [Ensete ventricosum]